MSYERIGEYHVRHTAHLGNTIIKTMSNYYKLRLSVTGEGQEKQVIATVINYLGDPEPTFETNITFSFEGSETVIPTAGGVSVLRVIRELPATFAVIARAEYMSDEQIEVTIEA